jgi:hypothetical protein
MPEQDNRPAVYLEGNTAIYRASALGHCLRMLWAARNNMDRRPIPKRIQEAMDEGTDMEAMILNDLYENHDFTYGYQGQQFVIELDVGTFNGIRCIVRGKVDEIGRPASNPLNGDLTIDVKKFGKTLMAEYRAKGIMGIPRYAWQQSAYAIGYGKQHFYMPVWDKENNEIPEWTLAPIPAPITFEQIRDRVMTVEEYFANGTMPEECPAEYSCQYYYLHDQKTVDHLPDDAKVLLTGRLNIDKKIATLSNARDILNEAIRGKLSQDVQYHLEQDDGVYTIVVIANPNKFNTNEAKALLTAAEVDWEHDPDFWTPGVGTQLRVTKPKKGKADGKGK